MSGPHLDDDRLIRWTLDELGAAERAEAEAHARACATCGAAVARLTAATAAWRSAANPDPPARVLLDLLEAQAVSRPRNTGRRRIPLAVAAGIAAALLVFAGGYQAGRREGSAETAGPPRTSAPATEGLPAPPEIAFQSTPPTDAWLASSPGSVDRWVGSRGGVRDSL